MRTADESNAMFCGELLKHAALKGKRILDIGCGNGDLVRYIADNHSPEFICGIEPALNEQWNIDESEASNWKVQYGNAYNLEFEDNTFDLVISFSTFEHIGNLNIALSEIRRVLKPFGKFYTEFAPLWTSAAGHHFIYGKDRWWNPEHIAMIPPWGHLYMSESEMKEYLHKQGTDAVLADEILYFIYHSDYINRLARSDITLSIMSAGMLVRYYEERFAFNRLALITGEKSSELTDNIVKRISNTRYNIQDIGVGGMRVCLEKYKDI